MIKEPPARAKAPVATGQQDKPTPRSRLPILTGVAVGLLMLVFYVITLSPTVNFIDSGELITVGATAGIAHPPGYPLYTLLSIIAAALSFGHAAVGVNMVSALAGAAAVVAFYALVYEILRHHTTPQHSTPPQVSRAASTRRNSKQREVGAVPNGKAVSSSFASETPETQYREWTIIAVAASAALLLGVSFTFWSWSTQAKNYTLHYVFVSLLFMLALQVRRTVPGAGEPGKAWPFSLKALPRPARLLLLFALALGLTFTNHPMSTLLIPTLAVLLFWPQALPGQVSGRAVIPDAQVWRWVLKYLPWLAVAGLVPLLLIYLYLPVRSSQQPILNWGSPDNLGDFWRHVTLWQSSVLLGRPQGGPFVYLGRAAAMFFDQIGPWLGAVVLLFAAVGVVRLARTAVAFLASSGLLVVLTLYQTYNFQNAEIAAYSVPIYMMIFAWAGVGLYWMLTALGSRAPATAPGTRSPLALGIGVPALLALLALVWNIGRAGHANNYLADAYVHNQFKNFAQNAVVITNNWYLVSPSYYMQYVQHERTDVAIIDRKLLQYPFYLEYVNRQYPQVMAQVKDLDAQFGDISRRWVNGEKVDSQTLSQLYFNMMHDMVAKNLAAGRPVYFDWDDPGAEENYIAQGFSTHPEGLALRVDAQPFTGPPPDPQFDFRGILTNVVPKDAIDQLVVDEYPGALDRLAAFAQQNNHPTEAAKFTGEAKQVRAALGLGGQ